MTNVGMVYRVEVVQTIEQANTTTKETAFKIGNILMGNLPDVVAVKVEELYEEITLFKEPKGTSEQCPCDTAPELIEESRDTSELRSKEEQE